MGPNGSKWSDNALHHHQEMNDSFQVEMLSDGPRFPPQLTALQAKVHYLRYLSEFRLYGGREFKSILLVSRTESDTVLGLVVPLRLC